MLSCRLLWTLEHVDSAALRPLSLRLHDLNSPDNGLEQSGPVGTALCVDFLVIGHGLTRRGKQVRPSESRAFSPSFTFNRTAQLRLQRTSLQGSVGAFLPGTAVSIGDPKQAGVTIRSNWN